MWTTPGNGSWRVGDAGSLIGQASCVSGARRSSSVTGTPPRRLRRDVDADPIVSHQRRWLTFCEVGKPDPGKIAR
jgi:hypothetical protein